MASISCFIISPTALLSFIAFLHGRDKTIPTPAEDWHKIVVDVVIPIQNEEKNIILSLASLETQTLKPRRVIIVDDASTDKTYEYIKEYKSRVGLEIVIIHREKPEGKTAGLKLGTRESDADVLFVLDGDTILKSENYIERLVQELYQGVGIACACGIILPFMRNDRKSILDSPIVKKFSEKHPETQENISTHWFKRLQETITSLYREELYLFLQRFIYHAQMIFFGSIINPVGCAAAYRRKYLKSVFDQYETFLGNNLTTSEDIFIGFSFADYGYRNIQIEGVYALTQEPPLLELPGQIFKWSSAIFQSCYYFGSLFLTPFKVFNCLLRWFRKKRNLESKKIEEMRKIKEAYRQSFGVEYTKKYGRPIGWYIFFAVFEKVAFPVVIFVMIFLKLWEPLLLTLGAEVLLYSVVIAVAHKNHRVKNFIKSIFLMPVRYTVLIYDVVVFFNFLKDLLFVKNKNWKK